MPHPSEFFLDMEKYYYILLTITFAGYAVCCTTAIATDTIYLALLQHTCGTLAILRYSNFVLTCFFERKYHSYVYDSVLAVTV